MPTQSHVESAHPPGQTNRNGDSTTVTLRSIVRMSIAVHRAIMHTIGARPAETGGVLLGPGGSCTVTEFYFDEGGSCSGVTYSPDHATINRLLKERWRPRGFEFVGCVHSHPGWYDRLSPGDFDYIRTIFACNPGLRAFVAPIVIPERFRLRLFLVRRDPFVVEEAVLELFDPDNTHAKESP